jgi:hypothetical protein
MLVRYLVRIVDRDSSVGVPTRYALDGPGIVSRWRRELPHPSRLSLWTHPASCTVSTLSFLWVKRPGRGVDHPLPSCTEVKERVVLYLSSPLGPSCPVLGRNFTLHFTWFESFLRHCFPYCVSAWFFCLSVRMA